MTLLHFTFEKFKPNFIFIGGEGLIDRSVMEMAVMPSQTVAALVLIGISI